MRNLVCVVCLVLFPGSPTTTSLSDSEVRNLMSRMQPYAECASGTNLYFERERKKLITMISSPTTTTDGQWRFFYTEAQSDKYLPEIFDNAVTSIDNLGVDIYSSIEKRREVSDSLTSDERYKILRNFPYLSARIHAAQQDLFWKYILNGKHKPLGEILDFWRRVEFQMKGTPHSHNLICTATNGIDATTVVSASRLERRKVTDLVRSVSTAVLVPRDLSDNEDLPAKTSEAEKQRLAEQKYDFNLNRPEYFKDETFPCRKRFSAKDRCFWYNKVTGYIPNKEVRRQFRRLQLANQMHKCRDPSCYKYCKHGQARICRYEFPKTPLKGNTLNAIILKDRDRKSRIRIRVMPPRNNANLNAGSANPLIVLATRGNHDIQFVNNTSGGAEYVSKYASKADVPESSNAFKNAISRKLAYEVMKNGDDTPLTYLSKLSAVSAAVLAAQQVGTVHACYILSRQKLVKSSRTTVAVNLIPRKDVTSRLLLSVNEMDDLQEDDSAFNNSPSSQFGKRDAYQDLNIYQIAQFGSMEVDFFSFMSTYTLKSAVGVKLGANTKIKEGVHKLLMDNDTGRITNAVTFILNKVPPRNSLFFCIFLKFS